MELKSRKRNLKHKIVNGLTQSFDGVLLLGVSSTCITLSVAEVGLIVVPIASGIGAGVSLFSKFFYEYLKREEQHNLKKKTLAGGTSNNFQKLHTKCLEDNKIDLNECNKLKQTYDVYENNKTKLNFEFTFLG